jgi:hypothetical protein
MRPVLALLRSRLRTVPQDQRRMSTGSTLHLKRASWLSARRDALRRCERPFPVLRSGQLPDNRASSKSERRRLFAIDIFAVRQEISIFNYELSYTTIRVVSQSLYARQPLWPVLVQPSRNVFRCASPLTSIASSWLCADGMRTSDQARDSRTPLCLTIGRHRQRDVDSETLQKLAARDRRSPARTPTGPMLSIC